ncbi:hypothetical protein ACSZN3_04955 [Aeromonas hydrophila]|uniref:hypothetical protein n=1 Tax=Aeromonas hydrophila TaxID=644 RepID=UPI0038D10F28
MILFADMEKALSDALVKKREKQARLRMAADELVRNYRGALGLAEADAERVVRTGFLDAFGDHITRPVAAIEVEKDALSFIITTSIISNPMNSFVVSVSIAMREKDELLSVQIETLSTPILVLNEGVEDRFFEVIEAIKSVVLKKIGTLV